MKKFIYALLFIPFFSCIPIVEETELYFPPIQSDDWETISPTELDWDTDKLSELLEFLEEGDSRAFIILKEGKIVVEEYWGRTLLNNNDFDEYSTWYWASAGKTLTSFLVGIAQQKELIDINAPTSTYLGEGWTNLTLEQESKITIKHQLTMTTGLDYTTGDLGCTEPSCLNYLSDPGTEWYYYNAPYTLLENVVSSASGFTYNDFTDDEIESKIGMDGYWFPLGDNNVYWSNARSAARFGLLMLSEGVWDEETILSDQEYYTSMITTSQELNPSYGYLWWLNGKSELVLPSLPIILNTSLAPNAPADLYAAIGKNGQYIDIVPSEDLVVIRLGEDPSNSLVPTEYHNDMWKKIMLLMN